METVEISIGREIQNDIVLNNPVVDAIHCYVFMSYPDIMWIKDNDSVNGTYVNGRRIVNKCFKLGNKISLGSYELENTTFYPRLFHIYKTKKTNYTLEYKDIISKFAEYQKKKDSITDPKPTFVLIRLGIGLIFILVLVFFNNLIPSNNARYIIMLSIGLLSIASSLFSDSQSKKVEKLDKLKLDYEEVLVCPKCGNSMINSSYTYWKGKSSCVKPGCNAIYVTNP
ncbi:MAG TPA: FHA domain-containing protein [Saprospiraceae bacterium]|nr:FHA domain-containing protein [Saprospiraceae bacterium]